MFVCATCFFFFKKKKQFCIQARQVNILRQLTAGSLAQMVPKKPHELHSRSPYLMMNQANQPAPLRAGRPADLAQLLALLPQVSKAQPARHSLPAEGQSPSLGTPLYTCSGVQPHIQEPGLELHRKAPPRISSVAAHRYLSKH